MGREAMLELIAMVAGIVICVLVPIEVGKIRRGWVRPKFAGDRAKFLAAYRKQLARAIVDGVLAYKRAVEVSGGRT